MKIINSVPKAWYTPGIDIQPELYAEILAYNANNKPVTVIYKGLDMYENITNGLLEDVIKWCYLPE